MKVGKSTSKAAKSRKWTPERAGASMEVIVSILGDMASTAANHRIRLEELEKALLPKKRGKK